MRNILHILLYIIFLSFTSCKPEQTKFNQSHWKTRNDLDYNHRELMIEDLSKNYLKLGMKFRKVENLLGKNDFVSEQDSLQLQYEIYVNYGSDIDPIETKTLIVNFDSDSTLTKTRIDHWKK
ncbi:hypothetical protein [Flavobacterium sp.]|jgi:hypothetical protein|uniref:hypothetical protein n=1 Tax=Flavobacterium sp. TaxID=239 RepID=UPI0037C1AB6E